MSKISESGFIKSTLKGVLVSVVFILAAILLFALFIGVFDFSYSVIKPVNQVIKVCSVFLGALLCVRKDKGIIKGALIGLLSTVAAYAVFALMGGEGLFGTGFFLDLMFLSIIGALSGIISVNVKKSD